MNNLDNIFYYNRDIKMGKIVKETFTDDSSSNDNNNSSENSNSTTKNNTSNTSSNTSSSKFWELIDYIRNSYLFR